MDPKLILYILRVVLCNEAVLKWLKEQAAKSDTPLDDTAVRIVEMLLCQKT